VVGAKKFITPDTAPVFGRERVTVVPFMLDAVAQGAIPVPETNCPAVMLVEEETVIELVPLVPVAVGEVCNAR
jgi:hypothetical protein